MLCSLDCIVVFGPLGLSAGRLSSHPLAPAFDLWQAFACALNSSRCLSPAARFAPSIRTVSRSSSDMIVAHAAPAAQRSSPPQPFAQQSLDACPGRGGLRDVRCPHAAAGPDGPGSRAVFSRQRGLLRPGAAPSASGLLEFASCPAVCLGSHRAVSSCRCLACHCHHTNIALRCPDGPCVHMQRLTSLAVRLASSLVHRAWLSQQRQEQAAREPRAEALRDARARRFEVTAGSHCVHEVEKLCCRHRQRFGSFIHGHAAAKRRSFSVHGEN